jgi:hypothetical protein
MSTVQRLVRVVPLGGRAAPKWYDFESYVKHWLGRRRTLCVSFTQKEYDNLVQLAERRAVSPETILRRFAATCQPLGGGWAHPSKRSK